MLYAVLFVEVNRSVCTPVPSVTFCEYTTKFPHDPVFPAAYDATVDPLSDTTNVAGATSATPVINVYVPAVCTFSVYSTYAPFADTNATSGLPFSVSSPMCQIDEYVVTSTVVLSPTVVVGTAGFV